MPYYEDWEMDENFYEPSPYDEVLQAMRDAMMKNIKREILDELERLRKENEELATFRDQREQFEWEVKNAKREYERKAALAAVEARQARLLELFGGTPESGWKVDYEREYIEKCDKCDNDRRLHFNAPSGKEMTEPCPYCAKYKNKHSPKEIPLISFKLGYKNWMKGEVCRYYQYAEESECDSGTLSNVYKSGTPFEKVSKYRIVFTDLKTCEEYCAWLNEKEILRNG